MPMCACGKPAVTLSKFCRNHEAEAFLLQAIWEATELRACN